MNNDRRALIRHEPVSKWAVFNGNLPLDKEFTSIPDLAPKENPKEHHFWETLDPSASEIKLTPAKPVSYDKLSCSSMGKISGDIAYVQYFGFVIDSSQKGIAIEIQNGALPDVGSTGDLILCENEKSKSYGTKIGVAKVVRKLDSSDFRGVALEYEEPLISQHQKIKNDLLSGVSKINRIENQKTLAFRDINSLENEIQKTQDWQVKYMLIAVTLSSALFSVYLMLCYQGAPIGVVNNFKFSFIRILIAIIPGLIAIMFALLTTHKSSALQRMKAFTFLLKEFVLTEKYPREYRGSDTIFRKYDKNYICDNCSTISCMGRGGDEFDDNPGNNKMFFLKKDFSLLLKIAFLTYLSIISLSSFAFAYELITLDNGIIFMSIFAVAGIVLTFMYLRYLYIYNYNIHSGSLSFEKYRTVFKDMLTKCHYSS